LPVGRGNPWATLKEVATGRLTANVAEVALNRFTVLVPVELQATILGALPLGAGCVDGAGITTFPARVPRRVGGVLVFDRDDTSRKIIRQTRSVAWLDWFGPQNAWAVGVAPVTTQVLTSCAGTQAPLSDGGTWGSKIDSDELATLDADAGVCQSSASNVAGSGWYNVRAFGPDLEAWATFPDPDPGAARVARIWLAVVPGTEGTASPDGYRCQIALNTTDDTVLIHRIDNGNPTTIGSSATQDLGVNDASMCRRVGAVFTANHRIGGTWANYVTSAPDATYTGRGYVGIGINDDAGSSMDDVIGGSLGGTSLGNLLLGR